MTDEKDYSLMEMAYGLAQKAGGKAGPNPLVGAVIVNKNTIVGHGYHEEAGKPHAEIIALRMAGGLAGKGTAYITLEPCVHWGRTPPCVDAVIEAGLKRVVISSYDPNPFVFRKGVRRMREAGIDVSVGLLEEKNRVLNEAYIKYITRKKPFVAVKAALSLDGKLATLKRDSKWISSVQAREYGHLLRGEHDAIMVGINTLLRDDPLLTVRHPNWKGKKITRVVLDTRLRFPLKARIFSTLDRGRVLIFTSERAPRKKMEALVEKGAEVIPLPCSETKVDLNEVLVHLGKREISSVLAEGGSRLLTSILEKRLADKIYLTLSPKLVGGRKALSLFEGEGASFVREAIRLKKTRCLPLGEEVIVEGYF